MSATKELTVGNPLPLIIKFALPLLLGNMLQQTYSMVDAAIVGRTLGINALAAVGASTSVVFLILGFCNGCCGGFAIPIAQKFGARDYSVMRSYIHNAFKLAWIMSLLLAVITSLLCGFILHTMRTPDIIYDGAYAYLLATFIGIPATFFYNLFSCVIRALGDSKTPFWFLLLASVLNIGLDLLFILTFQWGVTGAAVATVLSQAVSAILCYMYMQRKYDILQSTPAERCLNARAIRTLLGVGVPMGLQFSITAIGSIMLQSSNNALGTTCVAAFTAAMRIKMFFLTPLESLGIAMATYAGQNYGAGLPVRVWQGVKSATVIMMVYAILMNLLLWTQAEQFALLFVDAHEVEILQKTALFIHVSVSFYPMLGMLCILRYTIQGVGYTSLAMLSGVSEMFVCAHYRQCDSRSAMGLHRRLFWRQHGLGLRGTVPSSGLPLRLPTHDAPVPHLIGSNALNQ